MKEILNKILAVFAVLGAAALWFFKNKSDKLERENSKLKVHRDILEQDEPIDKRTEELLNEIDQAADSVTLANELFIVRDKKAVRNNTKPRRPK